MGITEINTTVSKCGQTGECMRLITDPCVGDEYFPIVVKYERNKVVARLLRTLMYAIPSIYLLSFDLFSGQYTWFIGVSYLFLIVFVADVALYALSIGLTETIILYKDKIVIFYNQNIMKSKSIQLSDAKYTATSWVIDSVLTITDCQTRIRIETSLLSSENARAFYDALSLITRRHIKELQHTPVISKLVNISN